MVIKSFEEAEGGEIFVPIIPSMKIVDLAKAIDPACTLKFTGIRPGEKLHESLVSYDEARHVKIFDGIYVITPQFFESRKVHQKYANYASVPDEFVFQSNVNDKWLSQDELRKKIKGLAIE